MRSSTVWGPLVALGFGGAVLTPLVRADGAVPVASVASAAGSDSAAPVGSSAPPSSVAPVESAAPVPAASASAVTDKPLEVEPPKGAWYGYQGIIASFAVSGATIAAYRKFDADKRVPLLLSAITLQIALTPWIHLGHGNHRAVGRSLALQASLVAGGALLGAYAVQGLAGCPGPQSPCDRLDQADFAALGALIGAIVAPAVDAGWLAFEPASTAPAKTTGVAIAPTFSLARPAHGTGGPSVAGGVVGVVGLF
ncbi:MAG: hypothetical protein JNL79_27195 [Myxococcales bacterium]|nr:hypothetical protein [Myxococcales bacterium]